MTRKTVLAILLVCISGIQSTQAQTINADNITSISPEEKATAVEVRLTGTLSNGSNGDFRQLRDLCHNMTTLDLSQARCTDIPKNAFHSRHQLHTLILPLTLRTIGSQALFACDHIKEISLPNHLEDIGASAFSMCRNIRHLNITTQSRLAHIGSYAFKGCQNLRGTITLPHTLYSIDDGAFEGCRRLKRIVLPHSLRTISTNTFSKCTSLSRVDIGSNTDSIGPCAFSHCTKLRHITVANSVPPTIDQSAFAGTDPSKITLQVPPSSIEAYRKSPIWKELKIRQ